MISSIWFFRTHARTSYESHRGGLLQSARRPAKEFGEANGLASARTTQALFFNIRENDEIVFVRTKLRLWLDNRCHLIAIAQLNNVQKSEL